ncbi:hypothetical protein GCM10023185_27560 [Hymenobacter saemangeumensis]|uniref:DUF1573 domain-containing protein n=1 Tax=Hymenobacter saemangeumensis TaxID=1084522 RepID=A0ABP8IK19_9BACT
MKFLPILAALVLSGTVASAQTKQPASPNASAKAKAATAKPKPAQAFAGAALKWDKTEHSFGEIKQGVPVTASFKYTNTSKQPVILTNAQGSCGCTVPNWSKEPLMPGKSQTITATFNAANPGSFNKTVTVTSNADGQAGPKVLTLQGTVVGGATAEAPKK